MVLGAQNVKKNRIRLFYLYYVTNVFYFQIYQKNLQTQSISIFVSYKIIYIKYQFRFEISILFFKGYKFK